MLFMHKYKLLFVSVYVDVCAHTLKLLAMLCICHAAPVKINSHDDIETVLSIFQHLIMFSSILSAVHFPC